MANYIQDGTTQIPLGSIQVEGGNGDSGVTVVTTSTGGSEQAEPVKVVNASAMFDLQGIMTGTVAQYKYNGNTLTDKGTWNNSTAYNANEYALYKGQLYVSITNGYTNKIPTENLNVHWIRMFTVFIENMEIARGNTSDSILAKTVTFFSELRSFKTVTILGFTYDWLAGNPNKLGYTLKMQGVK